MRRESLALAAVVLALACGPADADFFAETAVQTHRGTPLDPEPTLPCDPGDAPCQQYYQNGIFENNTGIGQTSTTTEFDFVDPVEFNGGPQRREFASGTANLGTASLHAQIIGDLQVSVPGGAITSALAAIADSASLERPGTPFGTQVGDVVTFTLNVTGSIDKTTVPGSAFNGSIIALLVARKGGITPALLFNSPNYICSFFWGIGSDADVIFNQGASRLPLISRLTSFPTTLTASCPAGREFDWAVVIRPSVVTFAPGNWDLDFSNTIEYQVNVPSGVDFTTDSGIVPPFGPAPTGASADHYMAYKTKDTKGNICAADSAENAGKSCQSEDDCGGVPDGEDETAFCIPNKFPKGLRAVLSGAFEPTGIVYDIKKPAGLCAPADKNGEGVTDPDTHLRSYLITATKGRCAVSAPVNSGGGCIKEQDCGGGTGPKLCIAQPKPARRNGLAVLNQFHSSESPLVVDAIKPDRLLVPTAKGHEEPASLPDVVGVDHYRCYTVAVSKGAPKFTPITGVGVDDQFTSGAKLFDLKKPTRLCVAAAKNGERIVNPLGALLCYQALPVKGQPKHVPAKGLHLSNQFGVEQADTIKEDELCVPSTVQHETGTPS